MTKNTLDRWLDWFYNERELNFFFLCNKHYLQVYRAQDGVSETQMSKVMTCDYPHCKEDSQFEYFPNLFPEFKNYEQQNKAIHNKFSKKNMAVEPRKKRGS